MKRITLFLLLFLLLPVLLFAAGSVTQTYEVNRNTNVSTLTFAFVGAADDGTVPSTATSTDITAAIQGMCIYEVITNPGSTAPTTLYDIVLNGTDGEDLMGGTLADRSATASQRAVPLLMTTALGTEIPGRSIINGAMTLVITHQDVHSATGTVKVFLTRP